MRPIKLEITGLQSFKEKQVIDFDQLTSLGIFGIFGETGSGKSTILDGMIFALFNEIPRIGKKGAQGIRPCLNQESDLLEVIFTFSLGKDIFKIRRTYQKRFTKTGEEKFEQKNPLLEINGDVVADKTTDVDAVIAERFGISVDDFTRSVVLPQGKFSEFLRLKGAEKLIMLENIFDLEKYGESLRRKVKNKEDKIKEELRLLNSQIEAKGDTSIELITSLEESVDNLSKELEEVNNKKVNIIKELKELEEIKNIVEKLKEYNSSLESLLLKENDIKEKETKTLRHEDAHSLKIPILKCKELKNEIEKYEENKNEKEEQLSQLKIEVEKYEEEENTKKIKSEELEVELEKYIVDYEKLDNIREAYQISIELKSFEENKKRGLERIEELEKSIINYQEEILEKKEKVNNLNLEKENLIKIDSVQIEKEREKLIELQRELKDYKDKTQQKVILEEEIKDLKKSIERLNTEKDSFLEELKKLEQKKRNSLAEILAKNLKEGELCPVCGSDHHPKLAIGESYEINEDNLLELTERLNNTKKELTEKEIKLSLKEGFLNEILIPNEENKIVKEIEDTEDKISKITKEYENFLDKKREIEKSLEILKIEIKNLNSSFEKSNLQKENEKQIFETIEKDIKNRLEKINLFNLSSIDSKEILEEKNRLEENEKQYRNLSSQKNNIDREITKLLEIKSKDLIKLQKISNEKIEIETKLSSSQKSFEEKDAEVKILMAEKMFTSYHEIKIAKLEEDIYENYLLEIKGYHQEVERYRALIQEKVKEQNNRTFDEEIWRDQKIKSEELENSYDNIFEELTKDKTKLENTKKLLEETKEIQIKIRKIELELGEVETLRKTVEGRKFVKFLARKKLTYIVYQASERIQKITKGRYSLVVDDNCDFDIVDAYNGNARRESSTLSGGETFVVSLSLALALSGQLQLKGNVQLEFFFLDEGFGTLDENLLDRVIEILEEIKWKDKIKIGIIGHVENLKIRIPRRLEVSPSIAGERGSKVQMY